MNLNNLGNIANAIMAIGTLVTAIWTLKTRYDMSKEKEFASKMQFLKIQECLTSLHTDNETIKERIDKLEIAIEAIKLSCNL